jgi:hypothetical protein
MLRLNKNILALLALAIITVFTVGCGETLKTEPVSGTVTLDGSPVEKAMISFMPKDKNIGLSATGLTDAEGKYTLTAIDTTAVHGAGTLPGEYMIAVIKTEVSEFVSQEEADEKGIAATDSGGGPSTGGETTYLVPKKYSEFPTSGLTYTVVEGDNKYDIKITSE